MQLEYWDAFLRGQGDKREALMARARVSKVGAAIAIEAR